MCVPVPAACRSFQVTPLQWPVHAYRRVMERALGPGFLPDAELEDTRRAAAQEAVRMGVNRSVSMSNRRLMRTFSEEDVVGPDIASAELSGSLGVGEPTAGSAGEGPEESGPVSSQRGKLVEGGGGGGLVSVLSAGSLVHAGSMASSAHVSRMTAVGSIANLNELDGELETILHDLHLILPGDSSSSEAGDSISGDEGGQAEGDPGRQQQQEQQGQREGLHVEGQAEHQQEGRRRPQQQQGGRVQQGDLWREGDSGTAHDDEEDDDEDEQPAGNDWLSALGGAVMGGGGVARRDSARPGSDASLLFDYFPSWF